MKISVNTAQYFSNVDIKSLKTDELIDKIGAQLGAVEEITEWTPRYDGIVIVRVVECASHPNADKLHVTKIDDGGAVKGVERDQNGLVQVVCGAPNVREGLLAAWIPPGATVPSTYGDAEPFVLAAKELRGVISNGMLASAAELGLSDNHDGLLEIDVPEVNLGDPFVKLYGLDDTVIDVENKMFTHRPDCFGVLGVAREIAGITGQAFKSPSWYLETQSFTPASGLDLHVRVDVPGQEVPRFMAAAFANVTIKPSPNWLQAALTRVGIRPINNVVDITNYVMYVTGQPLHAYDYDKVAARSNDGAEIIVRYPSKEEKLTLLNGKTVTPRDEAIMIASSKELIGVGGVMGGADTEVDENTKNIILEVASFDMYSIRRTSMAHGLFTDAVTRFNKGQSPWQNDRVFAYAADQLAQLASAERASNVIDIKAELKRNTALRVNPIFVNERLGLSLSSTDMRTLLSNVEFDISLDDDGLVVTAPFWRTDIEIAEDVVEEIGRLYGFDHLPLVLPPRLAEPTPKDAMLSLKSAIRHSLKNAGANEVLSYSFVHGDLMKKVGQDVNDAFQLSNALSPNLQYYRTTLTPSLLEKVHPNIKAGYDEFALFEMGKTHDIRSGSNGEGVPAEFEVLALVYGASAKAVSKDSGAAYFKAVRLLQHIASNQNVDIRFTDKPYNIPPYFAPARSAAVMAGDTQLGVIGEYTLSTIKNLKLPKNAAGFEIDLTVFMGAQSLLSSYVPLPRFPKVEQDISLRIDNSVTFADMQQLLNSALETEKLAQTHAILNPQDIYLGQDAKHFTFRLSIASYERTMTSDEVNGLLDKLAQVATREYGAERL